DVSDLPFLIANAGHTVYLRAGAAAGDVFTTGVGDNAASGKSPDRPMASLAALLAAYPIGAGDVIHVDTGTYPMVSNAVLDASHNGVRIEGPANGVVLLDRQNSSDGSDVIQLAGAQNVTLDHLSLTGGQSGVFAPDNARSTGLVVSNSDLYSNLIAGISLGATNDDARILNNRLHEQVIFYGLGVYSRADRTEVSGNLVYNNPGSGIEVHGPGTLISGNQVYGNGDGIVALFDGSPADRIVASGNTVHDNHGNYGMNGAGNFLFTNNIVYGHA